MYIYMYTYIYVYTYILTCKHITYQHTYIHPLDTYVCVGRWVYMHLFMYVYTRA